MSGDSSPDSMPSLAASSDADTLELGREAGSGDERERKGKGKDKAKESSGHQEFQAVYFGDDGYVVCALAYGDDVLRVPSIDRVNSLVNIDGLKPRAGAFGTLQ